MSKARNPNRAGKRPESNREYPQFPLVGIGALIIDGNSIVLIRRANPPAAGEWSIPGGLVRLGETLVEAVEREAIEETGLEVEPILMLELLERIFPDDRGRIRYHYVLADYVCKITGGALRAGTDALEARWVDRGDLDALALASITDRVVRKAFALQGHNDTV